MIIQSRHRRKRKKKRLTNAITGDRKGTKNDTVYRSQRARRLLLEESKLSERQESEREREFAAYRGRASLTRNWRNAMVVAQPSGVDRFNSGAYGLEIRPESRHPPFSKPRSALLITEPQRRRRGSTWPTSAPVTVTPANLRFRNFRPTMDHPVYNRGLWIIRRAMKSGYRASCARVFELASIQTFEFQPSFFARWFQAVDRRWLRLKIRRYLKFIEKDIFFFRFLWKRLRLKIRNSGWGSDDSLYTISEIKFFCLETFSLDFGRKRRRNFHSKSRRSWKDKELVG